MRTVIMATPTPTAAATKVAAASPAGIGQPSFKVSSADVYAPTAKKPTSLR